MRIVFFIPTLGSGGAERVISVLSNELVSRGNDVHIGVIVNRNVCYKLSEKVSLHYLDCEKDLQLSAWRRYPQRLTKIRRLVKELSPDVVISFLSTTNIDVSLALAGLKVPLIVSERNDPAIDPASKAKQLMRRIAYWRPTGFVFQTPDAQAYFSQRVQSKSTIILNPLSSNLPEHSGSLKEKRVVTVCRLNMQKNIPMMLEAFKKFVAGYPDYVLEIYGEGSLKDEIEGIIRVKKLDQRVILKGFCANVHQEIKDASMFVMSSDYEGMPNALLEAMAIGLPCISTDCPCGGPRMMMENGRSGLLVPVGNVEGLYKAMSYMASHPEDALRMGHEAKNIGKEADVQNIVDKWEVFIQKCLLQ